MIYILAILARLILLTLNIVGAILIFITLVLFIDFLLYI